VNALLLCLLSAPLQLTPHPPGVIEMVSTSSSHVQSNGISVNSSISDDGRYIAFESLASDLVPNDTNANSDVFLRDRLLGTTIRVSLTAAGGEIAKGAIAAALSGDGHKLGFVSAGQLGPGDINQKFDVFVRDLDTGAIALASATPGGLAGNDQSGPAVLSEDGRFVAFTSRASDLVTGDNNDLGDVFVRDMLLGTTERVSVASDGAQGNGGSLDPAMTPDGRFVIFTSLASNLVTDDTNGQIDVFLRDRQLGTTELMSRASDGTLGNNDSNFPTISADGHFVAFQSRAINLVPGDINGMTDVFVKDRFSGAVELISVAFGGAFATEPSDSPDLSSDGRFVAFGSQADNLIPPPPTDGPDHHEDHEIFLRDRVTGTTRQLSLTPAGAQADLGSINPQMNQDASVVAFETYATNLIAGTTDTNGDTDVVADDLSPWTQLQGGLAGAAGVPQLLGTGLLDAQTETSLALTGAAPLAPALLIAALQSTPVELKGGTLVAFPWLAQVPLATDGAGGIALVFPWPDGIPAGITLWFQALVQDAGAVQGVAISTALAAVTP